MLALSSAACSGIEAAGQQLEEQFEVMESGDFPPEARRLSGASLESVVDGAVDAEIWSEFELARRYEHGIGIERDLECAAFWYDDATRRTYTNGIVTGGTRIGQQRTNHPLARAALRRLSDNPETAPAVTAVRRDYSALLARCFTANREASHIRRYGRVISLAPDKP